MREEDIIKEVLGDRFDRIVDDVIVVKSGSRRKLYKSLEELEKRGVWLDLSAIALIGERYYIRRVRG